jgi:hypothetical protein
MTAGYCSMRVRCPPSQWTCRCTLRDRDAVLTTHNPALPRRRVSGRVGDVRSPWAAWSLEAGPYEAVATCLASPEVRARTEGVIAWRPQVA